MKNKKILSAFTIVELLVVIVVIGIIAAITIVSYSGISNRANTASLISAANTVVSKAEVYKQNTGDYPSTMSLMTGAVSTDPGYIPTSAASYFDFGQATTSNISTGMSAPTGTMNKVRYIVCGYKSSTPATAPTSTLAAEMNVKLGVIGLTWNFNTSAIDITSYQGIVNFGNGVGVQNTTYNVSGTNYNTICLAAGS